VQIELLGPLRVLGEDGAEIAVPGARLRRLLAELAVRRGIAMPICDAVHRLLQGAPARAIADELLARPLAAEGPGA